MDLCRQLVGDERLAEVVVSHGFLRESLESYEVSKIENGLYAQAV